MGRREEVTSLCLAMAVGLLVACIQPVNHRPGFCAVRRDGARHAGVDLVGDEGAVIRSPVAGTVAGRLTEAHPAGSGCSGVLVALRQRSTYLMFCHMVSHVAIGQVVAPGDVLGVIASRADGWTHVHVELCTYACLGGHHDGSLDGVFDPGVYLELACAQGIETVAGSGCRLPGSAWRTCPIRETPPLCVPVNVGAPPEASVVAGRLEVPGCERGVLLQWAKDRGVLLCGVSDVPALAQALSADETAALVRQHRCLAPPP